MTVCDNTKVTGGSGDFFKNLGKKRTSGIKKMATNVLRNPGRALEIGANVGNAFASQSPVAALSSLPEVINFYLTAKCSNIGKFV